MSHNPYGRFRLRRTIIAIDSLTTMFTTYVQLAEATGESLEGDAAEWLRFHEHLEPTAQLLQLSSDDDLYDPAKDDPFEFGFGMAFDDLINGTTNFLPFKLVEEISEDGGTIMMRCTLVRQQATTPDDGSLDQVRSLPPMPNQNCIAVSPKCMCGGKQPLWPPKA